MPSMWLARGEALAFLTRGASVEARLVSLGLADTSFCLAERRPAQRLLSVTVLESATRMRGDSDACDVLLPASS